MWFLLLPLLAVGGTAYAASKTVSTVVDNSAAISSVVTPIAIAAVVIGGAFIIYEVRK